MSERARPSLKRLYVYWRYTKARDRVRAIEKEWRKLQYTEYTTHKLLAAQRRSMYWRNELRNLQE